MVENFRFVHVFFQSFHVLFRKDESGGKVHIPGPVESAYFFLLFLLFLFALFLRLFRFSVFFIFRRKGVLELGSQLEGLKSIRRARGLSHTFVTVSISGELNRFYSLAHSERFVGAHRRLRYIPSRLDQLIWSERLWDIDWLVWSGRNIVLLRGSSFLDSRGTRGRNCPHTWSITCSYRGDVWLE